MTSPPTRTPLEATEHLPLLLIGLRWLLDTEQPAGALICPHGQALTSVGNRRLRFRPEGFDGRPAVFLEVCDADRHSRRNPRNTLCDKEFDDLAFVLSDCGEDVAAAWRDDANVTAALALAAQAPSSLLAAVARYRQGCPTHGGGVLYCCSWYRNASQHAISIDDLHRAALQRSPTEVAYSVSDLVGDALIARLPVHPPLPRHAMHSANTRAGQRRLAYSDRFVLRCKGTR